MSHFETFLQKRIDPKLPSPKYKKAGLKYGDVIMSYSLVAPLLRHCIIMKRFLAKIFLNTNDPRTRARNQAVKDYLNAIFNTYQAGNKHEKSNLLDHAELVTKRSRKQIIRRLRQMTSPEEKFQTSGRPLIYSREELIPHLKFLWIQMEKISAKRMNAAMRDWLPKYKDCPGHLKLQLEKLSATTLDRYLKEVRKNEIVSKGISTTCPARYMKNKIPISSLDARIRKPGFTQTDTVAHCGDSAAGPFISSLTVTDIFTTWTENRAMFTKKGLEVRRQFKNIEKALPFPLLAINSDSGSEFLNKDMLEFTKHGTRVMFTRSRPYKKNDNCFVEQKNFTHVRELFGYERFEEEILVDLMNDIYSNYWNPLQNFFLPTFKLKEKIRIGSKIKKIYDQPKTPFQRVIESGVLSKYDENMLKKQKAELDPFELKINLEIKLKEFFEMVRKKNIRKAA